jgi:N-acetylglucosaminyl-diphospho-decaprenol L-rhamnosyltransferase
VNELVRPPLSVVMVTYNSRDAIARSIPALLAELRKDDELVVIDNDSRDGTPALVAELAPQATVMSCTENAGFPAACNRGASLASGELIVFLNPDAAPAPGFRAAIELPLEEHPDWAAWMGLVTIDGGAAVNTAGNVIHFTGLAWAGELGRATAEVSPAPHEVAIASGACLAVPRERWNAVGGFPEEFFLYHEDVDLSLRLRLAGGAIGVEPRARVDHDYEFTKGAAKWRLMERNRWAVLVRDYPAAVLVAIAPALIVTELALVLVSLTGGWGRQKALATWDFACAAPRLMRERRAIQRERRIGAGEFARWLSADLSSPYLGSPALRRVAGIGLRAYWAVARALLRLTG